jgi:hypothetical protein
MFAFLSCFHPKIATASVLVWVLSRFSYTVSWEGGRGGADARSITRLAYPPSATRASAPSATSASWASSSPPSTSRPPRRTVSSSFRR